TTCAWSRDDRARGTRPRPADDGSGPRPPGLGSSRRASVGRGRPSMLAEANALAGNADDAAALEATLVGPTLRALVPGTVTVVGTRDHDGSYALDAGDVLETGATVGARAYIAVRGGIDVEPTLGSRSTDLLTGLGPPP